MHLIWENVVKNLMLLWSDGYKSLDTGREDYSFYPTVWEAVGAATIESGNTILSQFGPRAPDVANDKIFWTADFRSMWFIYVGPVLLTCRFTKQKYYRHFTDLVKLIQCYMQWEYNESDVDFIQNGFVLWVKEYKDSGPVWTTWTFSMKRYCSSIQPMIASRQYPFASIDRHLIDHTHLQLIHLMYDVEIELQMKPVSSQQQSKSTAHYVSDYDSYALLSRQAPIVLPQRVLDKVIGHICTRFVVTSVTVCRAIPTTFQQWSGLQLPNDGDKIRTSAMARRRAEDSRDASYIRVSMDYNHSVFCNLPVDEQPRKFYGQLQHILVVPVAALPSVGQAATTLVLGIVRSYAIESHHCTLNIHY
ncbi:hypothetical protein BDY19DRAFT_985436 [Irpex rosettiformis]|uniref:Uncharacterized protein n=1 Tax=Irpex rosettiformis TaxID=378272 RepID=A0ACB8U2M9_9APHY|nr:hypothetical protein BDY19DRAFT_985436 [Irpex rosettiformis]